MRIEWVGCGDGGGGGGGVYGDSGWLQVRTVAAAVTSRQLLNSE